MGTKILIVDDHGMMRQGLHLLIEQVDDMEVIGEASSGSESIELASKLKPDIVIMDVSMPGINGIAATKDILSKHLDVKILAVSAYCEKDFIREMLTAGASGYILKECMADELIYAIRLAMEGKQYLSSQVSRKVVDEYVSQCQSPNEKVSGNQLTKKELELVQLLADNKSNKEAARLLHISVKTVNARRRTAMEKLGITGIADLTKFAIREGLISLDDQK